MTPFEPTPDNRSLRNGPSSVTSNHNTHFGVLAIAWHAVSIDANFMRWSRSKWRYLKVQWDETSSILDLDSSCMLIHTDLLARGVDVQQVSIVISCSLQLLNKIENHIVFKVKATNLKKYRVHPNTRIVLPRSTCDVIVTIRAQKEASSYLHCKDKFLIQSAVVIADTSQTDITADMFNKDSGHIVEECKLKVVYVSPPQPPSPVPDGSEKGPSPKDPSTDNGNRHGNGPKGKILFYVVRSLLMVRRPPLPLL
ncbi:hypothetical protein AAG906_025755 [Vitis piasezkii]